MKIKEKIVNYSITYEDEIINQALAILKKRIRKPGVFFTEPAIVTDYLTLTLAERDIEVFMVLLLDNKHGLIHEEILFRGTICECTVYPREVARLVLKYNASTLILVHNHPSGSIEPSPDDLLITKRIKEALELIDVQLLDHILIAQTTTISMRSEGLF
jgi:DNA repair protein RadC